MKLFINTAEANKITISLDTAKYVSEAKEKSSQLLLQLISRALVEQKAKIDDITEVEVFLGPGSFTGLRVGVAVAQALSWSLNIPINNKHLSEVNFLEINYQ